MAQHPISPSAAKAADTTSAGVIAAALSFAWLAAVGVFFWVLPPQISTAEGFDSLRLVLLLVAIFTPVAMIWVAAAAAKSARIARAESFRMQAAIDAMRQKIQTEKAIKQVTVAEKPAEKPATTPAGYTPRPARRRVISKLIVPQPAPVASDQPRLALGTRPEDMDPPLQRPDLVRALNFPDDEHDEEGFAALRRALRDRNSRKLVQASQDVLTLLSQDGIFMDELEAEPGTAGLWRRFAGGERGKSIDRLGAVRTKEPLMLAAGRMREDTIFRDAVHHFLRRFDQMLLVFAEHATDDDLLELSETRTARAFMLLARATGTFD
ncbi:hypothetical protein ACJ5NV_02335 [Loktanella agnita]|uniref:hypothetical protein n=1 Tax=Loktanella agnita TaxID=287097 RepID=UPI003988765C